MSTPEVLHITLKFFAPCYLHHLEYQTFILHTVMGLAHPLPLSPWSPQSPSHYSRCHSLNPLAEVAGVH